MHILKMRPIIRIIAAVTLVTFASSQLAFGYERKMGTVPPGLPSIMARAGRIGDSPHFSKLRAKAAGENNEVEAELANALGGEGRDDQPVAAAGIPLPAKEEAILAQPYPLAKSATPVGKMSLSRRLGAAIVLAGALFFSWISKLQADVPSSPRIIFKISVPIGSGSNAIDREKARYSLTKSQRLGLLAFIIGGGVILHNEKELRPALIFELLTSGAIPAIAASQNGQPTLDNALCGVSAGLVKLYAEKGMVDTGIGAPFKIIYCLGDSVVNNLIIGEKPLSRYDIDFGPLLFERMEGKTKVYLLPDSTYFLLANISKGNKFSVPLTLRYGTPIFIGNGEKTWELGGVTAAGTTRDNIVIIKPSWEDMKYVPNHETGHAWAYPSFRFLGYGIDRKIHEKWKWVPGWVRSDIDIGYTLFGLGSDRLTGFSPHDERLIELVPQSFTNYEFATARAAGIKNGSSTFLSAASAPAVGGSGEANAQATADAAGRRVPKLLKSATVLASTAALTLMSNPALSSNSSQPAKEVAISTAQQVSVSSELSAFESALLDAKSAQDYIRIFNSADEAGCIALIEEIMGEEDADKICAVLPYVLKNASLKIVSKTLDVVCQMRSQKVKNFNSILAVISDFLSESIDKASRSRRLSQDEWLYWLLRFITEKYPALLNDEITDKAVNWLINILMKGDRRDDERISGFLAIRICRGDTKSKEIIERIGKSFFASGKLSPKYEYFVFSVFQKVVIGSSLFKVEVDQRVYAYCLAFLLENFSKFPEGKRRLSVAGIMIMMLFKSPELATPKTLSDIERALFSCPTRTASDASSEEENELRNFNRFDLCSVYDILLAFAKKYPGYVPVDSTISRLKERSDEERQSILKPAARLTQGFEATPLEAVDFIIKEQERTGTRVIYGNGIKAINIIGLSKDESASDTVDLMADTEKAAGVKESDIIDGGHGKKGFIGPAHKKKLLEEIIPEVDGPLTIYFGGHGSKEHLVLSANGRVTISYSELAVALSKRKRLEETTLFIESCYSYNFAVNSLKELNRLGINSFPLIITAANEDSMQWGYHGSSIRFCLENAKHGGIRLADVMKYAEITPYSSLIMRERPASDFVDYAFFVQGEIPFTPRNTSRRLPLGMIEIGQRDQGLKKGSGTFLSAAAAGEDLIGYEARRQAGEAAAGGKTLRSLTLTAGLLAAVAPQQPVVAGNKPVVAQVVQSVNVIDKYVLNPQKSKSVFQEMLKKETRPQYRKFLENLLQLQVQEDIDVYFIENLNDWIAFLKETETLPGAIAATYTLPRLGMYNNGAAIVFYKGLARPAVFAHELVHAVIARTTHSAGKNIIIDMNISRRIIIPKKSERKPTKEKLFRLIMKELRDAVGGKDFPLESTSAWPVNMDEILAWVYKIAAYPDDKTIARTRAEKRYFKMKKVSEHDPYYPSPVMERVMKEIEKNPKLKKWLKAYFKNLGLPDPWLTQPAVSLWEVAPGKAIYGPRVAVTEASDSESALKKVAASANAAANYSKNKALSILSGVKERYADTVTGEIAGEIEAIFLNLPADEMRILLENYRIVDLLDRLSDYPPPFIAVMMIRPLRRRVYDVILTKRLGANFALIREVSLNQQHKIYVVAAHLYVYIEHQGFEPDDIVQGAAIALPSNDAPGAFANTLPGRIVLERLSEAIEGSVRGASELKQLIEQGNAIIFNASGPFCQLIYEGENVSDISEEDIKEDIKETLWHERMHLAISELRKVNPNLVKEIFGIISNSDHHAVKVDRDSLKGAGYIKDEDGKVLADIDEEILIDLVTIVPHKQYLEEVLSAEQASEIRAISRQTQPTEEEVEQVWTVARPLCIYLPKERTQSISGADSGTGAARASGEARVTGADANDADARAAAIDSVLAQAEGVQQEQFDTAVEALAVGAQEQVRHSVETVLVVASSAGEAEVIAGALVEIGVDAKSIGTIIAQNLTPEQIAAYLRSADADIVIIARRINGHLLFVLGGIKIAVGTVTSSLAELKRRIVEACA